MKIRVSIALAAALLGAAATAHADAREDLQNTLHYYASDAFNEAWSASAVENARDPEECRKAIATAKRRGVSDGDALEDYDFKHHPKATLVDPRSMNQKYRITVADAPWFCDQYAAARTFQAARVAIEGGYDTYEWMKHVKPEETGGTARVTERPTACIAAIDGLLTAGKKPSDTVLVKGKPVALEAARKECVFFLEEAARFDEAAQAHVKGKRDDLVAIYKKAGMKGARLELFVESGHPDNSGWLLPGCSSFVTDPKKMAKAKKLFTWSEGPAGYVVTKYVFKKHKYTHTTRSFSTQEAAYRWCR